MIGESGDQDCLPGQGLTATRRHSASIVRFGHGPGPRSFVLVASHRFRLKGGEKFEGGGGIRPRTPPHPRSDEMEGRVINAANIPRISPAGFDTLARPRVYIHIEARGNLARERMLIASNGRFLDFDRSACVPALPSSSINPESNVLRLSDLIQLGREMYGVMSVVPLRCYTVFSDCIVISSPIGENETSSLVVKIKR